MSAEASSGSRPCGAQGAELVDGVDAVFAEQLFALVEHAADFGDGAGARSWSARPAMPPTCGRSVRAVSPPPARSRP